LADAEEFFDNDDGENAIAVLEGIMQGCVDGWEEVEIMEPIAMKLSKGSIMLGLKPF
jgi:hypothetical protein